MEVDFEQPMRVALSLARNGWGNTHPNPMVGAVILEGGEIVAQGWHAAAGQDHAEIAALKNLGRPPAADAVMCVTLEPCSTEGRTGACTKAIIDSGLRQLVVGTTDPNPRHSGSGLALLRDVGVEVLESVLEPECKDLNLIFNHWIVNERPLIAAKIATTLDGKIATRTGHSRWITSQPARLDAHRWRRLFPGIACGSGTVEADDPALTSRLPNEEESCGRRFIFDRSLGGLRDLSARVFQDSFRAKTTVVTWEQASPERIHKLKDLGIGVWQLPASSDSAFFTAFAKRCAENGIIAVLVEGGPRLLSAMLAAGKLDYLFAYRAPKLMADEEAPSCFTGQSLREVSQAFELHNVRHAQLGDDQLLRGYFQKP